MILCKTNKYNIKSLYDKDFFTWALLLKKGGEGQEVWNCWHVSIYRLFYDVQPFTAIAIFSFILWMGLLICNREPFWQEESAWSMILRWLLRLVGLFFRFMRTTVYMLFSRWIEMAIFHLCHLKSISSPQPMASTY